MAGRGPQTFKKRQKEQQRKEKQQEKEAKRVQRKQDVINGVVREEEEVLSTIESEALLDASEFQP